MGSMIHLAVGRLEIDWGKNSAFSDFSALFQPEDLSQVPYYYVADDAESFIDEHGDERYKTFTEFKVGMAKPLGQVIDRVRLLGHTIEIYELEYTYLAELNGFDETRFTYQEFSAALAAVEPNEVSADYGEPGEDFGKFFRRQIYPRLGLSDIARDPQYACYHIGEGMENVSAYTVLQLLALNPKNHSLLVTWHFADVEEAGWADRLSFVRTLDQPNRFLIVTEGSSDAKIIRHALKLLRPHIADFFDFVDMEEGYPFSGTGNLFRFLQGLISISIQNNVIVIYDNDAEGVFNFERSRALNVLENMLILKLPDRPEFASLETIGPHGKIRADINGCAAAIECYLDLGSAPLVRWTSFNSRLDRYQGELIDKERFAREFLEQRQRILGYDYSRLEAMLDMIVDACVTMREAVLIKSLTNSDTVPR